MRPHGGLLKIDLREPRRDLATSDSGKLIGASLAGLGSIGGDGYRYKKASVLLLDPYPAAAVPCPAIRIVFHDPMV